MSVILKIAAAAVLVLGFLALMVPWIERRLMYFTGGDYLSPAEAGLNGIEERVLAASDGTQVMAWYAPAAPGQKTLLYFHGNAGSLASRAERIAFYAAQGIGIFIMTYRGFPGSTGEPSEANNVADGLRAYDALRESGVAAQDIVIYGESIGTGVAAQVAAARAVGGLVLDAPYTSMVELAALLYPALSLPGRFFMRDRYDTRRHIRSVSAPLLIIHGEEDEIIPVEMGRELYAAASEPKAIKTYPGAGHADHAMFGSQDAVADWIGRLDEGARRAS